MRAALVFLALPLAALSLFAPPASAQTEEQLKSFFEGKSVVVKLEMPGAQEGIDIYPGTTQPIEFPELAKRLKKYGTALRRGEEVLVTKVKVKKDLIEFQLGGGGYGTFGDDASPTVSISSAPKTEREKNLEKDLKTTTDPGQKRKMKEELDSLKRQREREDSSNQAEAAQAQQIKEANIRQRRLEGGSRFNLRYKPAVPPEAMTPDGVMRALAEYLDFSQLGGAAPAAAGTPAGTDALHKGLTAEQVDALLGRPEAISQKKEGTFNVSISTYRTPDRRITAEFVEGVLVRFTISSP